MEVAGLPVEPVVGSVAAGSASEARVYSSTTPNGTVVEYSPAPRRFYRVDGVEVPSVTTVLGCLDKPALPFWGMKVGVEGVLDLFEREILSLGQPFPANDGWAVVDSLGGEVDTDDVVKFLTQEKLTVNHVRDQAGDRGTSVHDAFEEWCKTGQVPHPEIYPESESGYVAGLVKFIRDFDAGGVAYPKPEVMVGSSTHGYAGRFDLRCYFNGGQIVTRCYQKKKDKVESIPAGNVLLDLKTSSSVYKSHALQLIAYELASVECGYEPTDYRAVVRVTADGKYEFRVTTAEPDDFLSVLNVFNVMKKGLVA